MDESEPEAPDDGSAAVEFDWGRRGRPGVALAILVGIAAIAAIIVVVSGRPDPVDRNNTAVLREAAFRMIDLESFEAHIVVVADGKRSVTDRYVVNADNTFEHHRPASGPVAEVVFHGTAYLASGAETYIRGDEPTLGKSPPNTVFEWASTAEVTGRDGDRFELKPEEGTGGLGVLSVTISDGYFTGATVRASSFAGQESETVWSFSDFDSAPVVQAPPEAKVLSPEAASDRLDAGMCKLFRQSVEFAVTKYRETHGSNPESLNDVGLTTNDGPIRANDWDYVDGRVAPSPTGSFASFATSGGC